MFFVSTVQPLRWGQKKNALPTSPRTATGIFSKYLRYLPIYPTPQQFFGSTGVILDNLCAMYAVIDGFLDGSVWCGILANRDLVSLTQQKLVSLGCIFFSLALKCLIDEFEPRDFTAGLEMGVFSQLHRLPERLEHRASHYACISMKP